MKSTNVALNTTKPKREEINASIMSFISVYSISIAKIKPFMPLSIGIRTKYLFIILMAVRALKQPSKTIIYRTLELNGPASNKAVDYLHKMGYISKVGKPRLIIPFQKFKVDTGYVITELGGNVLKKILS